MNNNSNNCTGTLKISENVISEIALTAVNETDGVMPYNTLKSIGRHGNQPPVTVKITDGSAEITVLIDVEYGHKVKVCVENVQESIKSNVQDMTGIIVSKVNVKIISLL